MAVNHYENFPVASILLPRRLREPVVNIYRYARTADDIADEGDAPPEQRLASLGDYQQALDQIAGGHLTLPADHPLRIVFEPLIRTIQQFSLPLQPFRDLLSAFQQDVVTHRYENDAALLDYCSRSANPVGLLMLHLYDAATPANIRDSNAICTGLQLVNFWQDVAIDWGKNRVYLPQDKMARHEVTEDMIAAGLNNACWQALMKAQVDQARAFLLQGQPLVRRLPGRIGLELGMIVQGGLRILQRLDQLHYDIYDQRPTLAKRDWLLILWRTLRPMKGQGPISGFNNV